MPRKPESLWEFHSLVAGYVMPSKKLCLALAKRPVDVAEVRKLLDTTQLSPKTRKKLHQRKNYYYFGEAFIQEHESEIELNPLLANWHYRFVCLADDFHKQLQRLAPQDDAKIDLVNATAIASEFQAPLSKCTLQRLKAEVRAAEHILRTSLHSRGATEAPETQKPSVRPKTDGPSTLASKVTVKELAEEWGCGTGKIYTLINSGKLAAIDTSTGKGKRPRYLINRSAIEEFERNQSTATAVEESPRRQRRQESDGVTKYF